MNHTGNNATCTCPSHRKETVLTLDGGGIRGLATLMILKQLLVFIRDSELRLDRTAGHPDDSGLEEVENNIPLACHYFSFMFGTSTGGIIAIMLGRLRMDIDTCIDVYRNLGSDVFAKKRSLHWLGKNKYDCTKLEKIVQNVAQTHSREKNHPGLADPKILNEAYETKQNMARNRYVGCRVGVFAFQSDPEQDKLHLFRSYQNPTPPGPEHKDLQARRLNLKDQETAEIWKIARATSAAPTYFRPMIVNGKNYIDGGIAANNPSEYAWVEVSMMHQNHPAGKCWSRASDGGIRYFVSLGTGKQADQKIRTDAGPIPKLKSLVLRGIKGMTDPEPAHEWLQFYKNGGQTPAVYYRFNVESGLEDMQLDECEMVGEYNITFNKIREAVDKYVLEPGVRTKLQDVAEYLVDHRRQKCRPGKEQRFRDLCEPGPLRHFYDDRFRDDFDIPTSPTQSHNGHIEPSEMPGSALQHEIGDEETRHDSPRTRHDWTGLNGQPNGPTRGLSTRKNPTF